MKEVEDVREKGESLRCACAERWCRKGTKMSTVFLGKAFAWQKRVIFVKRKKITTEVMFALRMNKSCKVESC